MTRTHGYSGTRVPASSMTVAGGVLPRFVTPTDVRDLKNRIDPFVRALDQSVLDCKPLPDAVRNGWQAFSKAWRGFFDEDDSWLHTAAQMDQGEAYQTDLARWQDMINTYRCAPGAPAITPLGGDNATAGVRQWQGTIKTVAVAGAVIAVVVGLRTVLK